MKTLVVDVDGTLVDPSMRDYMVYHDTLVELGHRPLSHEAYRPRRSTGTSFVSLLALTVPKWELHFNDIHRMRWSKNEDVAYLAYDVLLPNVAATLGECRRRGLRCCAVTARSNLQGTFDQLRSLGLDLDAVYVTSAGPKHDTICSLSDVVCVVGDTEHDIVPAQALGITSVAVTTGVRNRAFLEGMVPPPDHVFDDIAMLLDVVR